MPNMDSHYAYFVTRVYDLLTQRLTSPEPKEWSLYELLVHTVILILLAWHLRDVVEAMVQVITLVVVTSWSIRIGIDPF